MVFDRRNSLRLGACKRDHTAFVSLRVEALERRELLTGEPVLFDINRADKSSLYSSLVSVEEEIFFIADDGQVGAELWKTDGTIEGTVLVKDVVPGKEWSQSRHLTSSGGLLYFAAVDGLWRSDGTEAGTFRLNADGLNYPPEFLFDVNGWLVFDNVPFFL